MAMTVSNNTPSAGFIQWANVHITYKGVTHAIANGSTDYTYIYWKYSDPDSFYGSNTFPTLGPDDLLVFLNKNGIHAKVPNSTVVDGSIIVPESIIADAIAANAITTTKIAADAITAEKVAANAIGAEAIAAGAISADKLVSYSPNLMGSGYDYFDQLTVISGSMGNFVSAAITDEDALVGIKCLKTVAPSTIGSSPYKYLTPSGMPTGWIPVVEGRRYTVSCYVKTTAVTANTQLQAPFRNAAGAVVGANLSVSVNVDAADGWTRIFASGIAPTGAVGISLYVRSTTPNATHYWDAFQVEELGSYAANGHPSSWKPAGTTVINGGNITARTISADRLATDTITAASGVIADAAIGTAAIANLAVTTGKIANLAVGTAQIANAAITNAKIGSLAVDTAQIADGAITNAKIANLTWDKGEGGTLKLGESYGDGVLEVWADTDSNGTQEQVGRIDSFGAYSPVLMSEDIRGNVENKWMLGNVNYYFDATNGNDENDGLSWANAKNSIQIFINSMPKNLNNVSVTLNLRGTIYGGLMVVGFNNGNITIAGDPNARPKIFGITIINRCTSGKFYVQYCDGNGDTSTNGHPLFSASYSDTITFYRCKAYGNNRADHGYWFENTKFILAECHAYDVADRGVYVSSLSFGTMYSCKGVAPVAILCDSSILQGSGTRWSGSVVRWGNAYVGSYNAGGTAWVNDVWTVDVGELAPPAPPPATDKTLSVWSNGGDTWSSVGGYNNDKVTQGQWGSTGLQYGLWYFDLSAIKGKIIVSATITVTRKSGGTSATRTVHFRTHGYTSRANRPGSTPAMSNVGATGLIGVGETRTFDLTEMVQWHIASGADYSIGVHITGSTDYMNLDASASLSIRYK